MTPPCEEEDLPLPREKERERVSSLASEDSAGLFVGVSFARAGYRGQFVTEIRAGPFYRRNNYFRALPVGVVLFATTGRSYARAHVIPVWGRILQAYSNVENLHPSYFKLFLVRASQFV